MTVLEPSNFGEITWRGARLYPDKIALEQDDVAFTYRELESRIERCAALIHDLGVRQGDHVLLMLPNDYRFVECLLGALRVGAIVTPANIRAGTETLSYVAAHSEASVLIGHVDLAREIDEVRRRTPALRHVAIAGGEMSGTHSYDELLAQAAPGFPTVAVERSDVALLMYTSGSTGTPKGCMLTHEAKWWQARSMARTMLWDERDKALVIGPLYHANAMWACLLPMLFVSGGVAIVGVFDPERVLAAIARYRPTYTSGTPAMFSLLLAEREALGRYDVSSIELIKCGSAPVPAELVGALSRHFGCEVLEGYGLTEGGVSITAPRWGIRKPQTSGLPVPGVEIRIAALQEPGRDCENGEVGELWSRSPANAIGYFKQPEATAEKLTDDGWLRTGDLARRDADGYVSIAGRIDDMINCGGENVYPREVEAVLLEHPAIDEVCVVSANHRVKGQAPVAWVVARPRGSVTEEQVKEHFLARGPAYAHPRRVFFVDALPVSGVNKVDRARLEAETQRLLPDGLSPSSISA